MRGSPIQSGYLVFINALNIITLVLHLTSARPPARVHQGFRALIHVLAIALAVVGSIVALIPADGSGTEWDEWAAVSFILLLVAA